ncbi:MAG: gamma-glutamylcyclotransferase [Actinomycetota bacterium]|nr:gamma-glutamylcyclotransferase [Actinomycetota bacterium]
MDGATRLFVYGTLMPHEPLWPALAPYAVSWDRATAPGELWDTGRGFPCVRFDPHGPGVPGIVVVIDPDRVPEALAVLDGIEDEGRLYRRVVVPTSCGDAYAYEWLGATDGLRRLPDGWPRG